VPTILEELTSAFTTFAIKTVAPNDIDKGAYYVTADQRAVMSAAGIQPVLAAANRLIPIRVMGTDQILESSYYSALRGNPALRDPEPRMGRALLHWLVAGDELLLGTDGVNIFARKILPTDRAQIAPAEVERAVERVFNELDPNYVAARAQQATGQPARAAVQTEQFVRNQFVKEFALDRCGGQCEVPGCTYVPFLKDDGSPFIEVHHVEPLGVGGDDTIHNVAGVCPTCHRRAHYGPDRATFKADLLAVVATRTTAYLATRQPV
jgi:hypothetical protein